MPNSLSNPTAANTTKSSNLYSSAQKRIAPKIPEALSTSRLTDDSSQSDHFSNFLIPVDQVRWLYKEEKKASTRSTSPSNSNGTNGTSSANGAAISYANTLSSASGAVSPGVIDPSIDPNISLNLGEPTTSSSSSSNKWQPFNKWDSYSLEMEYRERMTLKNPCEARLIQVLNNLYEVDLNKRRCTPIYWENGKFSFSSI